MKLTEKEMTKKLAKNLTDIRVDRDLSQKQVAKYLNIHRSTYAYYETAKTLPSILILIKLSEFYNVSINDLLKGII